jgi:hypothetical protein
MKLVLLLLAVFTSTLHGFGIGLQNCDTSDDAIRHCASQLFDRNKDDVITLDELQKSFEDRVTYSANFNATIIMSGGK